MSINFNHTIVYARDSRASGTFLAEILGLAAPRNLLACKLTTVRRS
jgi:hypothetical protein